MTELKPCPFCGGEASWISDHRGEDIGCENDDCEINPATSNFYESCEEAIKAWNKRHEPNQDSHTDQDVTPT